MQEAAGRRRDARLGQGVHRLGRDSLDLESAAATIGAVCKYREDTARVRSALDRMLTT